MGRKRRKDDDDALVDIPWDEVNPLVVDFALNNNLTPHERAALNFIHRDELTPEQAAGYLRLSPEDFDRLYKRARRRLQKEYRRLTEGPLVVVPPIAWAVSLGRRVRMTSVRSCINAVDARLAPATAEALLSTVAAVLLMSTVIGMDRGTPTDELTPDPVRPLVAAAQPASTSTTTGPSTVLPTPSSPSRVAARAPSSPAPEGRAVGVALGPVDKPSTRQDDETVYGVEITPPVTVPDEPATGIENVPLGVGVGYECPAEPRPLVLAVACPVLEP